MIVPRPDGVESEALTRAREAVHEALEAAVAETGDGSSFLEERSRFNALQYEKAIEFALVAAYEAGRQAIIERHGRRAKAP